MRLTAGFAKGMQLESPKAPATGASPTRPTSDKVRDAVLNSLMGLVPDAKVLDLFAGTGAVGLEALSRGAAKCVFVEKNRRVAGCLQRNLASLQLRAQSAELQVETQVLIDDAGKVLGKLQERFDLVFVDPPYADLGGFLEQAGELLALRLSEDGVMVVESGRHDLERLGNILGERWTLGRQKRYGDTGITFLYPKAGGATA